ncbi:PHP domain-containing protein [Bacillus sp. JCM 19041]|uniref:PHP domain-containing protein n=1 Tax=Bacillus sp. JCM 19041 TaxID=1460637 RepID=UPI00336A39F3
MHVHSHYSDGADSIDDVLAQAKEAGITHISFVDHDTIASLREAREKGAQYGITIISGIEISAFDFKRNRKVHVLGFRYDEQAVHLQALCDGILARRQSHSLWQIRRLRESGIDVDEAAIAESAKPSNTIYKQHIMEQITDAPYDSKDYQSLYRSLFKGDGPLQGH